MVKLSCLKNKIYFSLFTFLLYSQCFYAQQFSDSIVSAFKNYTSNPREITYAHLNKSIFVKGETMGFTTYVIDKNSKKTSLATTNLYCTIENKQNKVIKSKLIKIEEGVGNGIFNIDSLFTTGQYTFKAYTNWQKNFDEQNFYTQTIKVIDAQTEIKKQVTKTKIDAQFLPEGGHAITNVNNTFGVTIKNSLGFGVPNTIGKILDSNNTLITNFKTNKLGIGSFSFKPLNNQSYFAVFNYKDEEQKVKINNIKTKGIVLNLKSTNNKVFASVKTNLATHKDIKNKTYNLTIHNGNILKVITVNFNNKTEFISLINETDLNTGINIFTIFDANNTPILERLYFKHSGIKNINSTTPIVTKNKDSVKIALTYKPINFLELNNLSVSILPSETRAYNHHHNIISSVHLQPYVKGYIENAKYYFTKVDRKKKFELDNLLITQGWSSYNWNNIFNNPPKVNYVFEKGIYFKAKVNSIKSNEFIMYPLRYSSSSAFKIDEKTRFFEQRNLFPVNNEELKLAEIKKKGAVDNPKLYLQYYPSSVPQISNKLTLLNSKYQTPKINNLNSVFLESNINKLQQLDEVVITTSKKRTRLEDLKRTSYGTVDIWDSKTRDRTPNLISYLSKWFATGTYPNGEPYIINRNPNSFNNNVPLLYIDDVPTQGFSQLINFPMDIIDYIDINKSGIGEGIRAGGGVIRIYTDPTLEFINNFGAGKTYQAYKFPLTFSEDKKFYKPIYASYTSDFYNEYGVIEWFPKVALNDKGELILNLNTGSSESINLYVEGIANNGDFISEVKTISIN